METIIILASVLQSTAIALGMGASTLAIANFFVAISDGTIDAGERKMMGVVYIVLRIAMWLILGTFTALALINYLQGAPVVLNLSQLTIIVILFVNAFLMTKRVMPSKFGPSIQAGSWYTLGIITALVPLGLADYTYPQFLLGYGLMIVIATLIVNGIMKYQKK